ncbi:MAG: hypothetical protein WCV85_00415 [Patescibacteria group bacterium]|jgi:hypothetical protein
MRAIVDETFKHQFPTHFKELLGKTFHCPVSGYTYKITETDQKDVHTSAFCVGLSIVECLTIQCPGCKQQHYFLPQPGFHCCENTDHGVTDLQRAVGQHRFMPFHEFAKKLPGIVQYLAQAGIDRMLVMELTSSDYSVPPNEKQGAKHIFNPSWLKDFRSFEIYTVCKILNLTTEIQLLTPCVPNANRKSHESGTYFITARW